MFHLFAYQLGLSRWSKSRHFIIRVVRQALARRVRARRWIALTALMCTTPNILRKVCSYVLLVLVCCCVTYVEHFVYNV